MTARIFDCESTGTDHEKDQIIEAAWLDLPATPAEFLAVKLDSLTAYCERFKPTVEISLGAQAVHHIIAADLAACLPSSSFALPADTSYLIGHNVDFDAKFSNAMDLPRICTLALSRHLFPEQGSHTQSAMLYMIGREYDREDWVRGLLKNAHAAGDDVRNCAILLRYLLKVIEKRTGSVPETWAELHEYSEQARIPTVMGFGKHKGTPIERGQLDPGYVRWYRGQAETDPYYLAAFERAGF